MYGGTAAAKVLFNYTLQSSGNRKSYVLLQLRASMRRNGLSFYISRASFAPERGQSFFAARRARLQEI